MERIYIYCAIIGGTLFLCQLLLMLIGLGGHDDIGGADVHLGDAGHDVGGHHDGHWGHGAAWVHGMLTFRAVTAALTFFGLGGMVASAYEWNTPLGTGFATMAGVGSAALMAFLMHLLMKLRNDGTVDIRRAIGQTGTVYLTIPANREGFGKVQVDVQNRTVEYQAVTFQDQLPTGAKVVVVEVIGPGTVEVAAAR